MNLSVVTWKWQRPNAPALFTATHVNVLRAALERHLHVPHELVCVTDDAEGIHPAVRIVAMPQTYTKSPRCRRRMWGFSAECAAHLAPRVLYIDLDVVIVDDLTPLVMRPGSIVGWKVGHAGVYSGSFIIADRGALDGAWRLFVAEPEGYPKRLQPRGVASDQAMLNDWIRKNSVRITELTERDGLVTYYGAGYERLEHLGVGPSHPDLPRGARIVVLGSADLGVLTCGEYSWAQRHWTALAHEFAGRAS